MVLFTLSASMAWADPVIPDTSRYTFCVLAGSARQSEELETAPQVEADFFWRFSPYFAIGPAIGYSYAHTTTQTLSKGTVTSIPMLLKFRLSTAPSNAVFFIEAGAGQFYFDHEVDSDVINLVHASGLDLQEKVDSQLGYSFGAGIDFYRVPQAGIGLEIHQQVVKPQFHGKLTTGNGTVFAEANQTVDLTATVINLHAAVHF
jgi:hypothetical protein